MKHVLFIFLGVAVFGSLRGQVVVASNSGSTTGTTANSTLLWGQTFTPTLNGTAASVSFVASRNDTLANAFPATVDVKLYDVSGGVPNPLALLASRTVSTAPLISPGQEYSLTADFSTSGINFVTGVPLAFVLTYTVATNEILFFANAAGYADGAMIYSSDGGTSYFVHGANTDLKFSVAAIPEPASIATALAGGALLLVMLRRGRPKQRNEAAAPAPGLVKRSLFGRLLHLAALAALLGGSRPAPLSAQTTAVSNLTQAFDSYVGPGKQTTPGPYDFSAGFSFTTGTTSVLFDGVTLPVFKYGAGAAGFSLSLYSGIGPAGPTGLVTALSGDSAPTGGNYTYTPGPAPTLLTSTTYWLVATAPTTPMDSGFSISSAPPKWLPTQPGASRRLALRSAGL